MPSGPGEMMETILAGIQSKTGKDVAALAGLVSKSAASTRKERVGWLMRQHGLGRVAANIVAAHSEGKATGYDDQDGLLCAMYAGPNAALKPIYQRLAEIGGGLGPDFSLYQCEGQTTFKRHRQFAWVKPSAKTRVDLGLALPGCRGRVLVEAGL